MFFTSTTPPTAEQSAELARGLMLAGRSLEAPRFHEVEWLVGQKFTESDDPDRTAEPWVPPQFIQRKDPLAQRSKTTVEDLPIPRDGEHQRSLARVVRGVLDDEDCAELISRFNAKGFTPALLNIGGGRQTLMPDVRDGHRVIVDCPELAHWLLDVLKPYLPQQLAEGDVLVEMNGRCRFLCYTPGQEFAAHCDGCYRSPTGERSRVTIQVYLHDVPADAGGATTFLFDGSALPCQPVAGSVLLFTQDLLHEGSLLRSGLKYTLRTEVMYKKPNVAKDSSELP